MTNEEIIIRTLEELNKEPDWQKRYADYADKILVHSDAYREKSNMFHISFPLSAYSTITESGSGYTYDIRFIGQSIGKLTVTQAGNRRFSFGKGYTDLRKREEYSSLPELSESEDWGSSKMTECRRILNSISILNAKTHSPEHKCENLLLREFSKTRSDEMSFRHIKPVCFGGKFVQVTTNLKASDKGEVSYSKKGGGIDILARVGVGANSHLCVFELKDENHASESMEVVVQQALSYAVFLAQLLDDERSKNWWKVLGYNGKTEPSHVIDVVGLMPKGETIDIQGEYKVGSFKLRTRSLYFDKEALYRRERFVFSGSYAPSLDK